MININIIYYYNNFHHQSHVTLLRRPHYVSDLLHRIFMRNELYAIILIVEFIFKNIIPLFFSVDLIFFSFLAPHSFEPMKSLSDGKSFPPLTFKIR